MHNARVSKGFTLIELIVVIVIIGILAVTAMPKFIDLKADAKVATFQGLKAAIQSVNSMVRAKALVQGVGFSGDWDSNCTKNNCVDIDGTYYQLKYGYVDRSVLGNLIENMSSPQTTTSGGKKIVKVHQQLACSYVSQACEYDWCDCRYDGTLPGTEKGDIQLFVSRGAKLSDAINQDKCYLLYKNAQSDGTPPTITIESSGC